jgi:hypothetical protein
VGCGVEEGVRGALGEKIDKYLLEPLLLFSLFIIQPPHETLVLLNQSLVLVHEVARHLF